jgi:hypothetical protein
MISYNNDELPGHAVTIMIYRMAIFQCVESQSQCDQPHRARTESSCPLPPWIQPDTHFKRYRSLVKWRVVHLCLCVVCVLCVLRVRCMRCMRCMRSVRSVHGKIISPRWLFRYQRHAHVFFLISCSHHSGATDTVQLLSFCCCNHSIATFGRLRSLLTCIYIYIYIYINIFSSHVQYSQQGVSRYGCSTRQRRVGLHTTL